jgi:hypothetical protein
MKKSASKKKKAAKAATKKPSRPVAKAKTAKPAPAARKTGPARQPAKSSAGTYTPQPIQGIGWAPFRYPLSS